MLNTKITGILNGMRQKNLDSIIALKPENISYVTDFKPSSFSVLILKDEPILFTSKLDIEDASEVSSVQVEAFISMDDIKKKLSGIVGIESSMTVGTHKKLLNNFKTEITDVIEISRIIKSKEEVENIKAALQIAESSIMEVEFSGTENEVAAQLEYNMRVRGSSKPSFETIVASGKRSSIPHAQVTTKPLESPVVIDWGAVYNNYSSDTTRTIVETEKQEEIFQIVLEAQEQAIKSIKPGVKASYVDKVARDVITEYGYGDSYIHSTGHGLGIEVHEEPSLSTKSEDILKNGMVVTVEPGIYLEGEFGVRTEDVVLIDNGAKVLTKIKKKLSF
ncbi:M24 family metallopeptidase [Methanobacterium paludis]|uniref:Xaa-Pro dipeptidase n=2 Tax=Methanobacterium paludis (strain DSM 25820 / JCM 18151 / SWAN1) TaxID=868131 RepID=F6D6D4_METPW|nr:Xaa-Pro dipeptidase [Methanobacterium paludis]